MLAENSAQAAETSRHLLEANQSEVDRGNTVTQQTAESLNKVLTELDDIIRKWQISVCLPISRRVR